MAQHYQSNKAEKQSYDYTYDVFERKDTSSEKEKYTLPKELAAATIYFILEV